MSTPDEKLEAAFAVGNSIMNIHVETLKKLRDLGRSHDALAEENRKLRRGIENIATEFRIKQRTDYNKYQSRYSDPPYRDGANYSEADWLDEKLSVLMADAGGEGKG